MECPCPENYRNKPTVQPCLFTVGPNAAPWCLYVSHPYFAQKGWENLPLWHCPGAFCRFAVFSKGSCSPSSKTGYQAVQLSHWSLFWACACEVAVSGLITNCSFPPYCIHEAFWLCCALKHYRGMSHLRFSQPIHRSFTLLPKHNWSVTIWRIFNFWGYILCARQMNIGIIKSAFQVLSKIPFLMLIEK